jgi:hypothetical protein
MSGRPEPDFQKYLDALSELGLAPGATIEAIRKAQKAILRTCHPDLFPGDEAKAEQAQRANNAKDLLEQMSKDGSLQRFALMHERTRRTGGRQTADALPASMVVRTMTAPAGMGKTRGWARATARRGARRPAVMALSDTLHIILAAPTIDLIEQIAADLAAYGLAAPVVTTIHSRAPVAKGGVTPAMKRYYADTRPDHEAILLVSHAAIFANPLPPDPASWDLVFDEMPETVSFIQIDGQVTHGHLSRRIKAQPLDNGLVALTPQDDFGAMGWLSRIGVNKPPDGGLVHYQELALALLHGHAVFCPQTQWEELTLTRWMPGQRSQFNGHLDILVLIPPIWFREFRSVTMMGASCLSHMTALLWSRIWQVEFRDDPQFGLPRHHTVSQCRRLTLHWLYEERATRAFLARKAASGESMFLATCNAVAQFYGERDFLWSAPQPGEDRDHGVANDFWVRRGKAFNPILRLPGRTHGLNRPEFLETHAAALLSVVNLTPEQFDLLHLFSLTDDEIDRALAFDVAYQDMARCAIRLTSGTDPCPITLLDQPTALEIAKRFPGCRVLRYRRAISTAASG